MNRTEYGAAEIVELCNHIRDVCYAGGTYTHSKQWLRWNLCINAGMIESNNELMTIVETNNLICEYLDHLFKNEYKNDIMAMQNDEDLWWDDPSNQGVKWLRYVQVSADAANWAMIP